MQDIQKKLGEKIRAYRKDAGLSQEDLAEKAGISAYYAGEIERGQASPSLNTIRDIAQALGIQPKELFSFPAEEETTEQVIEEIVKTLKAGNITDIEDLEIIRNMIKRMAKKER